MSMIFFTCRSRTQARQGGMILKQAGIPWTLEKTPAGIAARGCGYGLRVPENLARQASRLLRQIPYEKSYRLERGGPKEVRYDLPG